MKSVKVAGSAILATFALALAATPAAAVETLTNTTGPGEECINGECIKWWSDWEALVPKSSRVLTTEGNTFFGVEFNKVKCNSSGAEAGEVKTNPLTGTLGFINKSKNEVGIETAPTTKGGLVASMTCGETKIEVRGAVIGSVTPVNIAITPEQHFMEILEAKEGKQAIVKFEGGAEVTHEMKINGSKFTKSGFTDSGSLVPSETSEIRTEPLEFVG